MEDRTAGENRTGLHKETKKRSQRPKAKEWRRWSLAETGWAQRKKGEQAEDASFSAVQNNAPMDVWVYLAGSLSGADKLISRCGYLGRALRHRCGRHEELEQQNEGDEAILIFLKANVIGGEKA